MKKTVAVFDIDGTLLKGSSAERIFIRHLISKGELSVVNRAHLLKHFLATFPYNWTMATKGNKFYLEGKNSNRIEELGKECFHEEIAPKISDVARRKIEEHRTCGLEIVLLSGTLDVLLSCFQEYLNADRVHGSTLRIEDGRYTGEICGIYPYGSAKAEIVRANYSPDSYDLSASYAYANHVSDLEFLELFGHSALVNPTSRLITRAKRKGIDMVFF